MCLNFEVISTLGDTYLGGDESDDFDKVRHRALNLFSRFLCILISTHRYIYRITKPVTSDWDINFKIIK